ncbi:MAG: MMPL family transporter, partial [Verrucomicrobia bacterium]|nr:MMPL family transporter [Verrucomicrobiota bacterium]
MVSQFNDLQRSASTLQLAMKELPPDIAKEQLLAFQTAFFTDIRETFHAIANQDTRTQLRIEDLPESLRTRFVGRSGQHLLQVYPRENAWERTHQETFVQELRELTGQYEDPPVVTGTPVQLLEYTSLLKRSYEEAAIYALIAIAIMIFVHFRSLVTVLLALLPVGVGWLWLIGVMGFLGIPFNPANIMTLPLVVGIGVTNGIHILNRYKEEQNPSVLAKSTGKGVLVSGLTTMAGFGSLTLASHRGIESLGYVMTIGVFTCMVAGLTLLPCLLQLRARNTSEVSRVEGDCP